MKECFDDAVVSQILESVFKKLIGVLFFFSVLVCGVLVRGVLVLGGVLVLLVFCFLVSFVDAFLYPIWQRSQHKRFCIIKGFLSILCAKSKKKEGCGDSSLRTLCCGVAFWWWCGGGVLA